MEIRIIYIIMQNKKKRELRRKMAEIEIENHLTYQYPAHKSIDILWRVNEKNIEPQLRNKLYKE